MNHTKTITTSIAPWLNVRSASKAVDFYKTAFGAVETYRLEGPDGSLIAKLAVDAAEFWVSDESPDNLSPESLGGSSARFILT
jgi:PhnB protein